MRWIHRTAYGIAVLLLWFAFLHPPESSAGPGIDGSWAQAYGEILKSDLRLGVDIVFTFGPLGYFSRSPYDSELIHAAFWFDLGFKLALALLLAAGLRRVPGALSKALLLVFLIGFAQAASDAPAYLAAAIGGALLAERARGFITMSLILAFLATSSMIKFPYLVASGVAVGAACVAHLRRPARVAAMIVGFAVALLLVFVLAGQHARDLIPYLRSSLEIAAGYSDAMAISGPILELQLGVLLIAVLLGLTFAHARFAPRDVAPISTALLFAAVLFFAFKAGFVTQDIHVHTTFGVAGGLALLLVRRRDGIPGARATWIARGMLIGSATLMVMTAPGAAEDAGALWMRSKQRTAAWLLAPRAYAGALEQQRRALQAKFALPGVQAEVGKSPIDIIDWDQGVLFLNGLDWRPRPVFHSYMTYSPQLQERNIAFMTGSRAPDFVLYQHQTRTEWFPTLAVTGILPVLLRDYAPVMSEGDYLLLARGPTRDTPLLVDRPPMRSGSIRLGEDVQLADLIGSEAPAIGSVYLALDIERSLIGRAQNALYKPPPLRLVATRDDGRTFSGRVLPGMIRRGLLLRPLLLTNMDLRDHALGRVVQGVQRFRIEVDPAGAIAYSPTIDWRIFVEDGPPRAASIDRWKGGP